MITLKNKWKEINPLINNYDFNTLVKENEILKNQ